MLTTVLWAVQVIKLDQDFGSDFAGVLTDDAGRVRALYGSYSEQGSDKEDIEWCAGLPLGIVTPWIDRLLNKQTCSEPLLATAGNASSPLKTPPGTEIPTHVLSSPPAEDSAFIPTRPPGLAAGSTAPDVAGSGVAPQLPTDRCAETPSSVDHTAQPGFRGGNSGGAVGPLRSGPPGEADDSERAAAAAAVQWAAPVVLVLEAELEAVLTSKATSFGLPAAWVARLTRIDPSRRQARRPLLHTHGPK